MDVSTLDSSHILSTNSDNSSIASENPLPITEMLTDISTNSDTSNKSRLVRVRRKHALPSEKRLCYVCGSQANGFVFVLCTFIVLIFLLIQLIYLIYCCRYNFNCITCGSCKSFFRRHAFSVLIPYYTDTSTYKFIYTVHSYNALVDVYSILNFII